MIGGVTMEINLPNGQEIHWIREMLQQGMVVGRHATATYIEAEWFNDVISFLFDTVRVPVFHLSKK